jgi:hypothetical protein
MRRNSQNSCKKQSSKPRKNQQNKSGTAPRIEGVFFLYFNRIKAKARERLREVNKERGGFIVAIISEKARQYRNKYMREYMRKYREKKGERRRELDRLNYAKDPNKTKKRQAAYWQRKAEEAEQLEKTE